MKIRQMFALVIWLYAGGGGIGMSLVVWWKQNHYFLGVPPQPGNPGWQSRCAIMSAISAIICVLAVWLWFAAWRNIRKHIYVIEGL
jgi:hypothetical protein